MALGDTVQSGSAVYVEDTGTTGHITLGDTMVAGNTLLVWVGQRSKDSTVSLDGGTDFTGNIDAQPDGDQPFRGSASYKVATATDTVTFTNTAGLDECRVQYVELEGTLELVDWDSRSESLTPSGGAALCGELALADAAFLIGGVIARHNVSSVCTFTPVSPSTELADQDLGQRVPMWLGRRDDATVAGTYDMAAVDSIIAGGGPNKGYVGFIAAFASDTPTPPPDPLPGPPFVCALDDTDLSELVCIDADELVDWSIRKELQGTGSGYIVIHRSHLAADEDVIKKGNWLAVTIPQIDADVLFVFQMERIETDLVSFDEGGGELVKIAGRGELSYFERAVAHPRSYVVPAGLDADGILHGPASTGNKAGQILNRALAEWQHVDRGVTDFGLRLEPIQHVTHDFDYDDDSDGNTWDTTAMTAEMSQGYVGEKGLVGILELIGTGEIDIVMWPTFLLQAFNSYGRDLTSATFATDKVRFVKGVNIAERLVRSEGLVVDPTHTIVKGQDESGATTYAFAESPVFGTEAHVEGFISTFGSDSAALEAAGEADMARRIRQGESVQFRVETPRFGQDPDPANGLYLPGPEGSNGNYWIGDTVTLHTGSGFRDYANVNVRVMAVTITTDDAGDLEVIVELQATTLTGRLIPGTGTAFGGVGVSPSPGGTGGGTMAPPPAGNLVAGHVNDATDAHDASAVSFDSTGLTNTDADDVQEAIEDLDAAIAGPSIPFDHGSMGAAETVDLDDGDWHRGTLDDDCTITVQGFTVDEGVVLLFEVTQDGTGGHAITWDADVDFGGADDQPSQTASTTTTFMLWSSAGDATIYGAKVGGGSSVTALDDLSDVVITSPVEGQRLRYNGTNWVNTSLIWRPVMAFDPDLDIWLTVVDGDGTAVMAEG